MNLHKLNYRDLIIFIIPLMVFSLYLFIYNPGILTVTSFSQLNQIATGSFTNSSPIFHTLLVKLAMTIYNSPIIIGVLQILIFSIIWTIICKYHRNDSFNSSNQFVMQFGLTLIICLIPINAVCSITLGSYVLLSYAILFLSFLIEIIIERNGDISLKLGIILAITLTLISGLNHYGFIISLITLALIIYYQTQNGHKIDIRIPAIAIVLIILIFSLGFIFNPSNETLTDPGDAINFENAKNLYLSSIGETADDSIKEITQINFQTNKYNMINSIVSTFKENIILHALFESSVFYLLFGITLLTFIYTQTGSKDIFLIYIPNLISFIMVIITNQFSYSNLLVFYLLTLISMNIWFKFDNEKFIKPVKEEFSNEETDIPQDIIPQIESLTLEEINSLLEDTTVEYEDEPVIEDAEYDSGEDSSDLIDEILKEIEMEKK